MQNDPLKNNLGDIDKSLEGEMNEAGPLAGDSFEPLRRHLPANRPPMLHSTQNDQSLVEEAKKKLYSKSFSGVDSVRSRDSLREKTAGQNSTNNIRERFNASFGQSSVVPEVWNHPEPRPVEPVDPIARVHHRNSLIKTILVLAILFFLGAIGYAVYVTYYGTNIVSSENIDMNITAPISVGSADPVIIDVEITNRNTETLTLADLLVTYPDGTRRIDTNSPITSEIVPVGTIKPGEIKKERIQNIALFAPEGSKEDIKITLEYKIPESVTVFRKPKDLTMLIGTAPIGLTVDTVNQISVGQDVIMNLDIKSNSTQVIKGTLLKASYPFGFQFSRANPAPDIGSDTWSLGDLAPNSEQKIQITGTMAGNENQDRVFKFDIGTLDPKDETRMGTTFVSASTELSVTKPFIGSDISLNGNDDPSVPVKAGESILGEVTWQNNLDVPINDVVIQAKLSGGFLDKGSVKADQGFYDSANNTIIWDKTNISDLALIKPGQSGRAVFRLSSLAPNNSNFGTVRNAAITADLSVHGTRLDENNVPQDVKSIVTKVAKIQSQLGLKTRLVRNIGPFINTGPFPTVAEKESTFTVIADVSNSYNTVKGVVYTTQLPDYVKWVGQVYPSTAQVSYDPLTRTVTWNVGDVSSGTGYSTPIKEMNYQVAFDPSLSQVGQSPIITNDQKLSGLDSFVNQTINGSDGPLDIQIVTDPAFKDGQGVVQSPH
jgi:hypothetical protein